jgi:glycolate oxidase iron-sulfur subunit
MQTQINAALDGIPAVQVADSILRSCVHCGFCLATCPTYQLLGDERDSPRGRIYLIKNMLEQDKYPATTVTHLDRCLTCRSCETTCPSGVEYGRLLDIGRHLADTRAPRSIYDRFKRWLLRRVLPNPGIFSALLTLGRLGKPLLPGFLKKRIPDAVESMAWPEDRHDRKMLVLQGCVQASTTPRTNAALANLLDKLEISLLTADKEGCCGAMEYHLSNQQAGLDRIRNIIDQWWPYVESGIERIIVTASGCGVMVKDYGEMLKDDPLYSDKADTISKLSADVAEILAQELRGWVCPPTKEQVAWHSPCSLQHGMQITGVVESLLLQSGVNLTQVSESHLCCGSAGAYSILQGEMSSKLLERKITALVVDKPDLILTANVGCQLHIQSATDIPVLHWVELIADKYTKAIA